MKQLTIMLIAPERARADVMLTPDRVYYRFATESTTEDGDLPGLKDFDVVASRILECAKTLPGETPLDPEEVKVTIFESNVLRPVAMSEQSLARLIAQVANIDPVFDFLRGFAS